VQIYQATQLYDVIAGLYFPNPAMLNGPYNGQVPGGMNSLTIQNASFWQLQYQDAVNGTIEIPPYCTVAFTVNPGMQYTITPQWALVNTAQTGTLVLPYGWSAADVYVSGNYSPIALPPSVANTWPYSESPSIVAGEFGPNQNDVEIQPRPPQHVLAINQGIAVIGYHALVSAVVGMSIRLRRLTYNFVTAVGAATGYFQDGAGTNYGVWDVDTLAPVSFNFEGLAVPVGLSFGIDVTAVQAGTSMFGFLTYDQY
jgi:hypothetical protein